MDVFVNSSSCDMVKVSVGRFSGVQREAHQTAVVVELLWVNRWLSLQTVGLQPRESCSALGEPARVSTYTGEQLSASARVGRVEVADSCPEEQPSVFGGLEGWERRRKQPLEVMAVGKGERDGPFPGGFAVGEWTTGRLAPNINKRARVSAALGGGSVAAREEWVECSQSQKAGERRDGGGRGRESVGDHVPFTSECRFDDTFDV